MTEWRDIAEHCGDTRDYLVWAPGYINPLMAWKREEGFQITGGKKILASPTHFMDLPRPPLPHNGIEP